VSVGLVAKTPSRQVVIIKEKHLNVLMTIKTSKCSVADFDYELAINMWKETKACSIYKNESHQQNFESFL